MKRFILILFIGLLMSGYSLFAESELKIDLTQICDSNECRPRSWYAIDSFEPNYFNIAQPDSKWKKIEQFPIWMNKIFSKEGNVATYTLMTYFDVTDDILNNSEQAGVRFGEIGEVFEIYINGQLIAKEGEVKDNKVTLHRTVRGQVWSIPQNILTGNGNHLLIKLTGHPKFDHTGLYLTKHYEIGISDKLKYEEQDRITLILLSIYITVGLYHLFLFYRRRAELYNFYYGAFALIVGVYFYTRSSIIFENNWDTSLIQRVELSVLYPGFVFLIESLEVLFFNKVGKWIRIFSYFSYTIFILTWISPDMYLAEYILRVWQLSVIICGIPILSRIFYTAIKQEISNAKRLLMGLIFFILAAIFDIFDSAILNSGFSLTKYAFSMYILGFAGVLANHFILIHNQIEELNENLEIKVEHRTQELSSSFEKIKVLKDQQDGDYFLTSLLLHPLGANLAKSAEVKIEYLLKQKKQFKFKEWESEIGGDLCRSQTIKLKNKKMTIFLNADAMGKSMQGAGGALVAGAVFNSIIERTILSPVVQNQYPERWLKNSFVEMHKVFESFDGSMLISLVMGLIDHDSGLLYLINAEHPYSVLYRDGQPSFIGEGKLYRKLGSTLVDDFICIQTFQLRDGDVIINGSDGRDDILIFDKNTNTQVLNYNEKIFLSIVKKADGKIDRIYKELENLGEFTDDLSLQRIEFSNNGIAIQKFDEQEMPDIKIQFDKINDASRELLDQKLREFYNELTQNFKALKYIIIAYIRFKQFKKAADLAVEYLDKLPFDTELMYYQSFALRKDRNFQFAIEIGERIRLREPENIKNLINLVQSYSLFGNLKRASEVLESAMKLQPEHKKIQRLKTQIDKAIANKK